jgi:hypothetical protein
MMNKTSCARALALLCALGFSAAALAANTEVNATNKAAPVKAAASAVSAKPVGTGGAPDGCPTTAQAGSGGGAANSQGAAVKGPVKPKCPGELAGKVGK